MRFAPVPISASPTKRQPFSAWAWVRWHGGVATADPLAYRFAGCRLFVVWNCVDRFPHRMAGAGAGGAGGVALATHLAGCTYSVVCERLVFLPCFVRAFPGLVGVGRYGGKFRQRHPALGDVGSVLGCPARSALGWLWLEPDGIGRVARLGLARQWFFPFSSAHNLFIDLLLWCGIPVGGALCVAILVWVVRRFRAVKTPDQAVLLLLVLLVLNHAMLEYPLYYAYILLPVGWLVGALEVRMGGDTNHWPQIPRTVMVMYCLSAITLLALIIKDYFPIEQAHRNLRLDRLHVQIETWTPPDALVLSHLSGHIAMVHAPVTLQLSEAELLQREQLTEVIYDGYAMFYLAAVEALNHRPEQATLWLQRFCKLRSLGACISAGRDWAQSGVTHPEIAAIAWPVKLDTVAQDNRPQ